MSKTLSRLQMQQLEMLIDDSTLTDVLDGLACICGEKSDHIESNWQNKPLAKKWREVSLKLERLSLQTKEATL